MSMKELIQVIGRQGLMHVSGSFYIQVRVTDVRQVFGRTDYQVTPTQGIGTTWVASNCVLDEKEASGLFQRFLDDYKTSPDSFVEPIDPPNLDRVDVGPSVRYEILSRDLHTCRYCGRSSPTVPLHVDHIISQDSWRRQFKSLAGKQLIKGIEYDGVNDRKNLVTSCQDCNLGKGSRDGNPPSISTLGSR